MMLKIIKERQQIRREREWRVRDTEMLFTWQVGAAVSKFTLQGGPHGTLVLNGT